MTDEDKTYKVVLKYESVLFSFIQFNDNEDKNLLMSIKRVIPDSSAKNIEVSIKDSFVKKYTSDIKNNQPYELQRNHKRYICFNTSKNRIALYEYHRGAGRFLTYGDYGMVIDEKHEGLAREATVKILTKCKNFETSFKLLN